MATTLHVKVIRRWRIESLVAVVCIVAALPAWAQTPFGAIDGVVRDESGGVLPGVTVAIASPALIEGARTTVTDAMGTYQFLRLPVGTYIVKFSLSGFKGVVRENVIINASFTATINASLEVGALEETVTVTGASPLVDIRTTTGQTVITSEVSTTIPSSRNLTDMSRFVLGASTSSPDVGGSSQYNYTPIQVHGSRASDRSHYVDGFAANGLFGDGDTPVMFNANGAREEIDYQTTAIPAAFPYGGAVMSAVSKSGGNTLSGEVFGNAQVNTADNLDDRLRGLGVRATSGSTGSRDIDGSLGGPIKKDRLWFFGSARHTFYGGLVANQFFPDGRQMTDDDRREAYVGKFSLKLTPVNKLGLMFATDTHERPYRRGGANFVAPEAANHNYFGPNLWSSAAWTGTRGNAWLYELQAAHFNRPANQSYRDEVGPNDVARLDIVTSVLTGGPTNLMDTDQSVNYLGGSVTRVGNWFGSHELRTGIQSNWGFYTQGWAFHGDIFLRFRNGAPDSVDLLNTPTFSRVDVNNLGLYLQDSWRIHQRLTINAGVRYDKFNSSIPMQKSPAGTWVPAREYPAIDVVPFNNVVPRLGLAYDLDGHGRTVLKGSYSKYVGNEAITLASSQNPVALSMNRCVWTDTNRDLYAQANEITSCAGWTGGVTTTIDPNLRRPFNNEYSLGVQRQLTTNFAGSVTYYRREQRDLRGTVNRAVPSETYIPVVINNPLNNQPLTIYNQNPTTTGRQDNVVTNSKKLDTHYNGIEFTIQRRFTPDAYIQGGYHYGKNLGRIAAGELNDPNADIFADGAVGTDEPHQLKIAAVFLLPGQVSVSGFLQAYSGHPRVRSLQVGRALVPTLTRATQTVRLERNDENRYESNKLVDLRIGRRFRFGSWRYEVFADAYNLFNANTVLADVTTIGSSLGQISETIRPRVIRLGGKFAF